MDVGRGQKVEYRRLSSKNDLILCTNDAIGHDISPDFAVLTAKSLGELTQNSSKKEVQI